MILGDDGGRAFLLTEHGRHELLENSAIAGSYAAIVFGKLDGNGEFTPTSVSTTAVLGGRVQDLVPATVRQAMPPFFDERAQTDGVNSVVIYPVASPEDAFEKACALHRKHHVGMPPRAYTAK